MANCRARRSTAICFISTTTDSNRIGEGEGRPPVCGGSADRPDLPRVGGEPVADVSLHPEPPQALRVGRGGELPRPQAVGQGRTDRPAGDLATERESSSDHGAENARGGCHSQGQIRQEFGRDGFLAVLRKRVSQHHRRCGAMDDSRVERIIMLTHGEGPRSSARYPRVQDLPLRRFKFRSNYCGIDRLAQDTELDGIGVRFCDHSIIPRPTHERLTG